MISASRKSAIGRRLATIRSYEIAIGAPKIWSNRVGGKARRSAARSELRLFRDRKQVVADQVAVGDGDQRDDGAVDREVDKIAML